MDGQYKLDINYSLFIEFGASLHGGEERKKAQFRSVNSSLIRSLNLSVIRNVNLIVIRTVNLPMTEKPMRYPVTTCP